MSPDREANARLRDALRVALQPALLGVERLAERAMEERAEELAARVREQLPELSRGALPSVLAASVARFARGMLRLGQVPGASPLARGGATRLVSQEAPSPARPLRASRTG